MPKQQRVIRMEQKNQLASLQALEAKSDEELETETKFKAHAQLLLGNRAAERMDAKAARAHFQRALAAAKPQERMQFRRMADYALAHAERRADDFREASEKLGVDVPSNRQMRGLKLLGLLLPAKSAGSFARIRGVILIILLIIAVLLLGFGIVNLVALPFGGLSLDLGIFYGVVLVLIALAGLAYFGRRRQKAAKAKQQAEIAARTTR
jgi:hypothetical protein